MQARDLYSGDLGRWPRATQTGADTSKSRLPMGEIHGQQVMVAYFCTAAQASGEENLRLPALPYPDRDEATTRPCRPALRSAVALARCQRPGLPRGLAPH